MQIGLKIGNTFLVDKIESLNFKEIKEGNQFLIVKESYEKYDFLTTNINSYTIGTLKNVFYDMIYCFDKNDILPDSISFSNNITESSYPMLHPFYSRFFEKNFSFPENINICQIDKDIVNKSLGYKLNDNLAIIFNIEIKYTFKDKFPSLERDFDIYLITSDKKYDIISVNLDKFDNLLNFIIENTTYDILNKKDDFLRSKNLFTSDIISYLSGEKNTFSLYNEFNSLQPYYLHSYDNFNKLFQPFFVDEENDIKCYYKINKDIRFYGEKDFVMTKDGKYISSYTLQEKYKDIYRCIKAVTEYNDKGDRSIFNPYTGEVNNHILYEDYGCKLFNNKYDSWNSNKQIGIVPIGKYWVNADSSEIKEANDRKNTMEELKKM